MKRILTDSTTWVVVAMYAIGLFNGFLIGLWQR